MRVWDAELRTVAFKSPGAVNDGEGSLLFVPRISMQREEMHHNLTEREMQRKETPCHREMPFLPGKQNSANV